MAKRIYVADDELHIRTLIQTFLANEGYEVMTFENGDSLFEAFSSACPDLIILDIMMPGTDGLNLCARIRKESRVPIIIVSAKDSPMDRVTGITLGSDDYMVKPFLPLELVARVKSLLRRAEYTRIENPGVLPVLACGNLRLEPASRAITVGKAAFSVTPTEFDFLSYMLEREGQAVSKQELLREIWKLPDYDLDTRVADDLVKRLRRKLKEAACTASVETVWGFGFRMSGEKEELL